MNKEEILEKSRQENKNQDVYEKEVLIKAGNIGAITVVILCLILYCLQIFLGEGADYGLVALFFGLEAAIFTVKGIKLKRKHEIILAAMYIIFTLAASAAHIYNLIAASTIL